MSDKQMVIEKLDEQIGKSAAETEELRTSCFDEEGDLLQEDEADDARYVEFQIAEGFLEGLRAARAIVVEFASN